ncbi:PREDICTED: protein NRT1/ PTR FAMILY 7.1 [Camelina sativa]|uniref:Protein NRT1/ PTR FAMILY 7.1 n=1 Tax=Camelina sativa TaxID=90675 RepID=A0ABM1REE3_CAMSA|nr:PREDICTED: protein NRT1/ PTR FAMILY 7.1 [Camelina sativa]
MYERESATNLGVAEVVEVHDDQSVVSHTSNDSDLQKKMMKKEEKKKGGWTNAIILLANQGLATLAFFGVGVNLVLFLTRVMGQGNAEAANNVSKWTGTVYMFSLVGAFLSDSYWGRYLTCTIFQVIFVIGVGLLSFVSWFFLIKPRGCGDGNLVCNPTSSLGVAIFYLSVYLVAFGYGGHQPTLATFGADQLDDDQNSKAAFFSYFYFALNVGALFSNTILVYFEDKGLWTEGFLVSLGSAIVALVAFLAPTKQYRYVKPCGNPLPRVAQVFVATARKWSVVRPGNPQELYELEGPESAIKGSRKIFHSSKFVFLDRAAVITESDRNETRSNAWRLCSVTQVEEAKCVMKLLPIWLCTIIYSVIFTQMASLFVEQGDVMDAFIGKFHIPAASMSVFDILSVFLSTGLYRHVIFPYVRPTELMRMGIGLIIGIMAMVAAGLTEIQRLKQIVPGQKESELSILWQIPQYVLVGASEVFMYVGQLEFFSGQAPDGLKNLGSSLCMASMALGNYVSSLMVNIVMAITKRGEHSPGWIPENLNEGHMDRFYFLIATLAAIDFVVYLIFAKWYQPISHDEDSIKGGSGGNLKTVSELEQV